MIETIRPARMVKARKHHTCMASEWLVNSCDHPFALEDFSFTERRQIVIARRQHWRILPGQVHHVSVLKQDGEIYTFRAIPDIHAICLNHDLYVDC
jgi:hypothetical protein